MPYPAHVQKFDYEIELAVIIGKRGKRLTLDNAMEHVAGYAITIDLSARDWMRNPKHIAGFDTFAGKAFDDSCPLGPGIVPARFVNHENLQLQFRLNGELRQDANTKDMIWSVPEQLVNITQHVTLEPGDVVSTGTPAGVGPRLRQVHEGRRRARGRDHRSRTADRRDHRGAVMDGSTVLELDRIRRDAMTKADITTLGELFADDMVWIHATARADTKAGLLDAIGSGSTKYLSIDVTDETVRDFGDVVLVGGIAAMSAEIKGETRELRNRFTIVWARRGAAWQVVNWQSTSVRT